METKIAKPNLDANVQHLFDEEVFLTGITEYGTSWEKLASGSQAPPAQGARFDISFEGKVFGDKIKGKVKGVDYLQVRPDGKFILTLHATITTDDGATIVLEERGTMVILPNGDGQLYLTMNFSTAYPRYQWINEKQVWGIGTSFLSEGEGRVTISGFTN
ncbi:MAG: DUF3237 family protein [Lewinellaceae bacterium]|nr:DUF3237 family protein [Lewinellaceae bacterium]